MLKTFMHVNWCCFKEKSQKTDICPVGEIEALDEQEIALRKNDEISYT